MRRWLGAVGLSTTIIAMAACGSGGQSQAGPQVVVHNAARLVAATADATTKAKTAKMTIGVTVDGAQLGRGVSMDMDGAVAFDGSAADFKMNLASFLPSAPAGTAVEIRLVDDAMYMDFGSMLQGLGSATGETVPPEIAGVKWLKIDLKGFGSAMSSSPSSYTQYLEFLRAASQGDVKTIGTEVVRGVSTTHYHADLDPQKIAAKDKAMMQKLPAAMRSVMQKGIDAIESSTHTIGADVWIDSAGLTRRLEMKVPVSLPNVGASSVAVRVELYDFGTPVDVQAPPPSEVRGFSALAGLMGSTTS